jgi:hypothetical protein
MLSYHMKIIVGATNILKELGHEMNNQLNKISTFSTYESGFKNIQDAFSKRKINIKFPLASLKTLTNYKF